MKKVAFLDRDGTINVDHGYVHTIESWEFIPGAIEALQKLQQAGFTLAIVTNQSGIAQGYYTEDDMQTLHDHMLTQLQQNDVKIAAIAFCPHGRDSDCACRKPKTGMAITLEHIIGPIDYAASWTIGDKVADAQFGQGIGTKTALLRSTYWEEKDLPEKRPTILVDSLLEAVNHLSA